MADSLIKAHFVNCVDDTPENLFEVQFNPKELKLDDKANYSPDQGEQSGEEQEFQGREAAKLSMELIFDTTMGPDSGGQDLSDAESVNDKFITPLRAFLALTPPESGESDGETSDSEDRPVTVQFAWDQFQFTGMIEQVNTTFLMFNRKGVPVRARVALTMTAGRPPSATGNRDVDQTALLPAMVPQVSGKSGDTVGTLAKRTGTTEKDLMVANGIDDPLGDYSLDEVTIPDSSEMAAQIRDSFRDVAPKSLGDGAVPDAPDVPEPPSIPDFEPPF